MLDNWHLAHKAYLETSEWKELNKQARDRAGHKCELCGQPAQAVHHHKYPKEYKDDCLANLTVVCNDCHDIQHGRKPPKDFKATMDFLTLKHPHESLAVRFARLRNREPLVKTTIKVVDYESSWEVEI